MRTRFLTFLAAGIGFLMACVPAFAHHGAASFGTTKH
jgi:hypothetical protein